MTMEDLSAAKLDQIREILIGEQVRENERRLDALEHRFAVELERLGEQVREMGDSMRSRCEELTELQEKLRHKAMSRDELSELLARMARKLEEGAEGSNQ